MYSDGLVESFRNDQVIGQLRLECSRWIDDAYALGFLMDDCLTGGSRDNMACVLVKLKGKSNLLAVSITDYGVLCIDGTGYAYATSKSHRTCLPGPLYSTRDTTKRKVASFLEAYFEQANRYGLTDSPSLRFCAYRLYSAHNCPFIQAPGIQHKRLHTARM